MIGALIIIGKINELEILQRFIVLIQISVCFFLKRIGVDTVRIIYFRDKFLAENFVFGRQTRDSLNIIYGCEGIRFFIYVYYLVVVF